MRITPVEQTLHPNSFLKPLSSDDTSQTNQKNLPVKFAVLFRRASRRHRRSRHLQLLLRRATCLQKHRRRRRRGPMSEIEQRRGPNSRRRLLATRVAIGSVASAIRHTKCCTSASV